MSDAVKSRRDKGELARLRARLAEAEETLNAIRSGEVDAIAVDGPRGHQIYTLQSADQPYRILAERMSEGAAMLTAQGAILFCNRRLAEMVGVPAERLVGSPFLSLLQNGARKNFADLVDLALKSDVREQAQLLRKDGAMLPVQLSLSGVPVEDPGQGICVVVTDISDQKRAEQELRERAALLDLAHDAVIFRGLDGRILFWNRGAKDLYGWSADEAKGRISHELLQTVFPEPQQRIMATIEQMREWEGELRHIARDGKALVATSRWSLLRDERGKPTAVLEINRDITERKQAEESLKSASFYTRSLIEASLDPLVTISREGKITDVNQATEKITGLARHQLIGSDFCSYFSDPEEARKGYERVFAQGSVRDYPLAVRHTTGRLTSVLYNATIFRNDAGEVEGVFAAARDITERLRAEKKIRKLNEELEQRVAARTEDLRGLNKELEAFNYAVAHDLRAPLRHIHGFAQMLSEEADRVLSDSCKHHLKTILDSVEQMGQLLEELLRLSRLGRQELCMQVCDLKTLLEEVLTSLKSDIKDREVEWRIADLPLVECDPALFRQVLVNLLSNALKFTRPRHPAIIEIGQSAIDGEPVIFIRDNGVGFSMKYADKLFGVFQRLHRQHDFEGTGVGLAIVQRIMNRHGGRVWAEGELDKGATFYLTLRTCGAGQKELAAAKAMA
jgi:PAS domain S-box-containing protein